MASIAMVGTAIVSAAAPVGGRKRRQTALKSSSTGMKSTRRSTCRSTDSVGAPTPPVSVSGKMRMRPSGRTSTHAGRHTPAASLSSMRSSTVSGASSGCLVELIVAAGRRRCKGAEPSRAWSAAPRPSSIELIVAEEALRRGGCGEEL